MTGVEAGLVSTIIPVHNRPEMLREAVESVLSQTYRPIEVIISDDGSTDHTPDVARALERAHPSLVSVLLNDKVGPGPAREAGRLRARGEYVQYLDSDDRLLPRKFEVQVAALRARPECGAAYGWIRLLPDDGPPRDEPWKWSGRELPTLFPWLLVDRWWNTDCPLLRRSVVDAVGPWSDLRYSQDWEYDARVGALGTRLAYCPEWVCEQRVHAGTKQTGHGGWLEPDERVRFFRLLHEHAVRAGVRHDAPEMRHFVRWVFQQARECGRTGAHAAARRLLDLAVEAGDGRPDLDLRAYAALVRLLGWNAATRLASLVATRRPPSGKRTLRQSRMEG